MKLINLIVKLLHLLKQSLVQTLSTEKKKELKQAASWYRTQCIPLQKKPEVMRGRHRLFATSKLKNVIAMPSLVCDDDYCKEPGL